MCDPRKVNPMDILEKQNAISKVKNWGNLKLGEKHIFKWKLLTSINAQIQNPPAR